jgi:hypothetical protein
MARVVPLFYIPSITKNVCTMLYPSPTSQIFSTKTSHFTHYESQRPQLYVVQNFDANGSQSLLTLSDREQKNIFFFLQTL